MAADGQPDETPAAYARRIAAIARELGIPADYGAARRLEIQREAKALLSVGPNPDGIEVRLEPGAAAAWTELRQAAGAAGVALLPISGFRSVARQVEIIREKQAKGESLTEILRLVAAPDTANIIPDGRSISGLRASRRWSRDSRPLQPSPGFWPMPGTTASG